MDPLELVRKVTALTGFTHCAGVEVLDVVAGCVHLSLIKKPEFQQFNGFFHAGIIAGLAEHAAGAAATTALPFGKIAVTVDLSVNYIAPASGITLTAKAHVRQVGVTICVVEVEIETPTSNGQLVCAIAVVTSRIVDMPSLGYTG